VASLIYLDTHVLAWLYARGSAGLPPVPARRIEEAQEIRVSPMVRLELQYLYEIGRVTEPALPVLDALESALGLVVCGAPFSLVVREAETLDWTRDPFDRLIVAQASIHDAPLLTRDGMIHEHYARAVWD